MLSLLLALALAITAQAQQSPTSSSVMDFSGGLNTESAPIYLQPNESPDLMNVWVDDPIGSLVQRKGYLHCGDVPSGNTVTNLYEYVKSDGSRNLIVTDSTGIWSTMDCINWDTVVAGLDGTSIPRFETVNNKLWIVNGSTPTSTWDGTTFKCLDGAGTKPNVPRGRYIRNWKNRVWIASPPSDPSMVGFNILTDSSGTVLTPDTSTAAWNSLNSIYFGNDGSPIYGLYPYKDNMLVFKDRSVWRLLWESEFNLNVVKSVSSIGSKFNDSIVEMDDGSIRYVGQDGIYSYSGDVPTRASVKISPTFYRYKQPNRSEMLKSWSTADDFIHGTLDDVSTSYMDGSLALSFLGSSTTLLDDFRHNDYTTGPVWTLGPSSVLISVPGALTVSASLGDYAQLSASMTTLSPYGEFSEDVSVTGFGKPTGKVSAMTYTWDLFNTKSDGTGNGYRITLVPTAGPSGIPTWLIYLGVVSSGAETVLTSASCSKYGSGTGPYGIAGNLKVVRTSTGAFTVTMPFCPTMTATNATYNATSGYMRHLWENNIGNDSSMGVPSGVVDNIYLPLFFKSTGTYTTNIATATGLSIWSTFNVDNTLNGQSISYQIKTASTVFNMAGASWKDITPGVIVSTITQNIYVQVKSSFSTSNNGITPTLEKITVSWITGDSTLSPMKGLLYKSRYWLSGSTTSTNQYNDMLTIESSPPHRAYTLSDIPVSAMVLWNNNLYGAISNTPKIVRLDYGDNDDGAPITSYWSSRDEVYQNPIRYKSINRVILDYMGLPGTLSISLSPNEGVDAQTKTLNFTSGPRNTRIINFNSVSSQAFRIKITNRTLDAPYKIYGVHTMGVVTDFIGN